VTKKRFSVEQTTAVLQQVTGGIPVEDVFRQVGISEQASYRWKKVYGNLQPVRRRAVVRYVTGRYGVSERHACRAARFWRSSLRYER
jgi:hypothetical protein